MKKIISCILVVTLLILICGCATKQTDADIGNGDTSVSGESVKAYADLPRTYTDGKGEAWTLNNTYNCLTEKKQLTTAYIGGSITNGTGGDGENSWRQLTTKWFKDNYTDAKITEINAGVGGTGSLWGLFRLEKDVLAHNPDLIFIEFGVNDSYCGFGEMQSAALMDAMIRKINEHNPNIDIVLVFTTDESKMGKDYANIKGHRIVAEYYGVPYIDVGAALVTEIQTSGNEWGYYVGDSVHPNVKGYKVYADAVEKHIKKWLSEASGSAAAPHKISNTHAVTNPYKNLQEIPLEQFGDGENWKFDDSPNITLGNATTLTAKKKGAKITFEFKGAMLGYYCRAKENTEITITIDSESPQKITTKGSDGEYTDRMFLDNLSDGTHTVTIEYSGPGYIIFGGMFVG